MSLKKIFSGVEKTITFFVIILLGAMVVLIFTQVGARFIFNKPLSWTEELSRHLMLWMAFMATSIAYRHGAHLSIDLIIPRLSPKRQKLLRVFFLLIILSFLIYMVIYGVELTQKTYRQTSSSLQYPMSFIYLSIPVSAVLMMIFSIEKFIDTIKMGTGEGDDQT